MLFVNEIFASIQGEGLHAGTPCVFVRFQGCPVRCPWCDTTNAMPMASPNGIGLGDAAFVEHKTHASVTPAALWQHVHAHWPDFRHIILTGGEPCAQDAQALAQFCAQVRRSELNGGPDCQNWRIHVETSGTGPVDWMPDSAWVTLSPKFGTLPLQDAALRRADEIKMIVADRSDIDKLDALLAACPGRAPVCLQPRSQDAAATALCVETVMARAGEGWRLSVQLHKYLGVQ